MAVNELDAKTRAVEKMKAEPGKEMAAYQAAENQLLAIRAEQKQNLALARQEGAAALAQNATIGQAAELAASSGGGGTVQAPVNAATQNVLAKYGAGPTITKSTQRTTQQVTKQNVTINNYNTTTNNTTNNVPNTGPVQGRPVVVNRDDTGRFKVWVSNALARQNEQAAIRDKEYQRRESALTRSANKMTRKLEAISMDLSKKLDPRRQATTLGEQLKRVLKLIGIGVLAANWPKVLDIIGNIEGKFRTFLEYVGITGREERKKTGEETGLVKDIKYLLLGEQAKDFKGGLVDAIKQFFTGEGGLLDTVKKSFRLWLENRSKAIKAINPPNVSLFSIGDSIKGLMNYLKQVIGVLLEGPGGALKQAAQQTREEGTEKMTTEKDIYHKKSGYKVNGKHVSYGDAAFVKNDVDAAGAHYHVMKEDLTEKGQLKNNMGASLRQSAYLADNFTGGKATGGKINVSGILEGLSRIEKAAGSSKDKTTLVDKKFLKALENIGVDVKKIGVNLDGSDLKSGKLKEFAYISRKKTEDEKAEEFAQNSGIAKALGWGAGITAGTLTTFFGSAGGRNAAGSVAAGAYTGNQVRKLSEQWANSKMSEEYTFQLVPRSQAYSKDGKDLAAEFKDTNNRPQKTFQYYELTEDDMKEIKSQLGQLTGRNEDFSYDAEDVASTRAMAELLLKKSPKATLDDSYTKNMQELARLEGEMDEYTAAQKEIWDNSVLSGIENRAADLGSEAKEFATTGYTESIGGDSPVITKFKETTTDVKESIKDKVKNIRKKDTWDVDKALDTIKKNAASKSQGECLRYTANAINSGFGENTPLSGYHTGSDPNMGKITSAKYSGAALEKLGFERIPNDSILQKGDIHVFHPKSSWIAEGHPHGHIEMFDGRKWYSDFAQNTSGVNWGHYSTMETYRWSGTGSEDGDVIDSDISPANTNSPTSTISTQEAIAQGGSPTDEEGNLVGVSSEAAALDKAQGLVWDEETKSFILPDVDILPTASPSNYTISTPLITSSGVSSSDIAVSSQDIGNTEIDNVMADRLGQLVESVKNMEGITVMAAEASARNVDATQAVSQTLIAISSNNVKPKPTSTAYTSAPPSGNA